MRSHALSTALSKTLWPCTTPRRMSQPPRSRAEDWAFLEDWLCKVCCPNYGTAREACVVASPQFGKCHLMILPKHCQIRSKNMEIWHCLGLDNLCPARCCQTVAKVTASRGSQTGTTPPAEELRTTKLNPWDPLFVPGRLIPKIGYFNNH